ncbi:hypothetical protein F5B17DRAFT_430599 [Nemania serpens]|nr:hypothetical protein F5B17DRAFT_430599 [Nemania serpens]
MSDYRDTLPQVDRYTFDDFQFQRILDLQEATIEKTEELAQATARLESKIDEILANQASSSAEMPRKSAFPAPSSFLSRYGRYTPREGLIIEETTTTKCGTPTFNKTPRLSPRNGFSPRPAGSRCLRSPERLFPRNWSRRLAASDGGIRSEAGSPDLSSRTTPLAIRASMLPEPRKTLLPPAPIGRDPPNREFQATEAGATGRTRIVLKDTSDEDSKDSE